MSVWIAALRCGAPVRIVEELVDVARAWTGFNSGTSFVTTRTVKWFNEQKGYGFIQPVNGGKDVFVHISAVERSGLRGLAEGQKITYEVEADRRSGKESAVSLDRLTKLPRVRGCFFRLPAIPLLYNKSFHLHFKQMCDDIPLGGTLQPGMRLRVEPVH